MNAYDDYFEDDEADYGCNPNEPEWDGEYEDQQ